MNDQEMRKLALELAVASRTEADYSAGDIITRADEYFRYLKNGRGQTND